MILMPQNFLYTGLGRDRWRALNAAQHAIMASSLIAAVWDVYFRSEQSIQDGISFFAKH